MQVQRGSQKECDTVRLDGGWGGRSEQMGDVATCTSRVYVTQDYHIGSLVVCVLSRGIDLNRICICHWYFCMVIGCFNMGWISAGCLCFSSHSCNVICVDPIATKIMY